MTTISAKTFDFLKQLAANNNREWFQENKATYLAAKENVESFAQEVIDAFRKYNRNISPELTGKKSVMRIYRDVRFSKNKLPYKNNFGISISASPEGIHGPGYFIQLQPNQSFVAGGMWMPDGEHLKLIRQEIDYNAGSLLEILRAKSFKDFFGDGLQQNDKLKTSPKNYEASHPNIDLLKLKSFTVSSFFNDKDLQKEGITHQIVNCLQEIMPLNNFLQEAITPQ
ncbi:MAG TPA: DUF2461 domain-containing protein [Pelobium sp.]|nr:DUF2461 domain-containing protein [Pelobium sp.]